MRNNVTKLELPLLVLFPSILYGLLIYLQLMMKVLYSTYIQPGTLKVTSVYSIKYSGLAKVTWSITASNLAFVVHIYILTCSFILFLLFNLFKFKFLHMFFFCITRTITCSKKLHSLNTLGLLLFWVILGVHFCDVPLFLESCSIHSHKGLYRCFFESLQFAVLTLLYYTLLHHFFLCLRPLLVYFVVFFLRTACFLIKLCTYIINILLVLKSHMGLLMETIF